MNEQALVAKAWNYAHVLRDDGASYGDYPGQISFLLFLKINKERTKALDEPSALPADANWETLAGRAGGVKSGAGQHFTPRPLIEVVTQPVDPEPGDTMHDPAVGTGAFLLAPSTT